ncbi:NADPH:quinone reductase-like Zn-dependent oxidoreductase [Thermocatellispora tengchongensis]|uniref:NADPH:quinone reductase-like Zn-dependent oxidoreductase n=1 Tax=Thermocatellispora tengchongensis TaxID=1073253 RepID=A0A840PMR2_9ACTN|nr:zinc-binding dehydrogenase [Thermocatellispora tengchongensis]MBB5140342.1 NADPH:quinone reductase-like Zn-dependent oxidoreductase [Thermocatellispora tengchongensis]
MDMRALVVDPAAPGSLRLGTAPEPRPASGQVVLDVRHISLNRGEVAFAGRRPAGTVHGYDAAGVVVRAAADGTGPAVGARVAAFGTGAWAQRMAVDTTAVAEVPAEVGLADAAALPMAGITALRTLRSRPILGRRVLITGAAGGVGRYAVQLAALGGAHVIASVGSPARAAGLTGLGAHEVVVGLQGIDRPVDLILDTVGGPQLAAAWELLAPGGGVKNIGWASDEPAVFAPYSMFSIGPAKTMSTFGDVHEAGPDLATLLGFVAAGRLSPEVGWRGPWERVAEAARALLDRRIAGKAVLDVEPAAG